MIADDVVKAYESLVKQGINPVVVGDFARTVHNSLVATHNGTSAETGVDYIFDDGSIVMVKTKVGKSPVFKTLDKVNPDLGEALGK